MRSYTLEKIYLTRVLREAAEDIGNAKVNIEFSNKEKKNYSLSDTYATHVARKIEVDTSPVDEYIDQIFINADWTGSQRDAKSSFKSLIINSNYLHGIDLLKYLANNKSSLLGLNMIKKGMVINFVDAIVKSIPTSLRGEGLSDIIKEIHLKIVPSASTGVGLGEGTFTIFGRAKKGSYGDLVWDGKEVEVKTGGAIGNTGAVLGGDGSMNKVFAKLQEYATINYKDRTAAIIDDILSKFKILEADISSGQGVTGHIRNLKDTIKRNGGVLPKGAVDNINNIRSVEDIFFTPTTVKYALRKVGDGLSYYERLSQYLVDKMERFNNKGQNLPGQLSSFFDNIDDEETLIKGFAALKTYGKISIDIHSQLKEFFKTHNIREFLPSSNYKNFSNLVGSISLLCYQEIIGFDILTTGNDTKFTMAGIFFDRLHISNIYEQISKLPILFDLNIDAYEDGKARSKTVFAKSPRIRLM